MTSAAAVHKRSSLLAVFGQRHFSKKKIRQILHGNSDSHERAELGFHIMDCNRCVQRFGEVE